MNSLYYFLILKVLIHSCKVKMAQLRQQIQNEIDREAKIDRMIEAKTKKFLKTNKQFYRVGQMEECDAILIFSRDDLTKYQIYLKVETKNCPDRLDELARVTLIYIKNKNKHDNRLHTYSFLKNCD